MFPSKQTRMQRYGGSSGMVALSLHFHNQAYGNTLLHGETELLWIDTKRHSQYIQSYQ